MRERCKESEFQTDRLMDTEESLPPRYAIESDDEDEFNPLPHHHPLSSEPQIQVKPTGNISQNANLVIATGLAGKTWARGAQLAEQSGEVTVNGVQVLDPTMNAVHNSNSQKDRLSV